MWYTGLISKIENTSILNKKLISSCQAILCQACHQYVGKIYDPSSCDLQKFVLLHNYRGSCNIDHAYKSLCRITWGVGTLKNIRELFAHWRIKINESKRKQVTITLHQRTCSVVKLNGIPVLCSNEVTYLGVHLNGKPAWPWATTRISLHFHWNEENSHILCTKS